MTPGGVSPVSQNLGKFSGYHSIVLFCSCCRSAELLPKGATV
jgi:hypothetical protein